MKIRAFINNNQGLKMRFKYQLQSLLLSSALLLAPLAHADFYLGGQLNYGSKSKETQMDVSLEDGSTASEEVQFDASTLSFVSQGGFFFNDFSAIEMRYGVGITDSDGIELDNLIGAYGKFNFPVSHQVALYALAGYSKAKLKLSGAEDSKDDGLSLGGGFHYAFNTDWAMTAEYMSYVRNSNVTVDGFSLALQFKF